MALAPLRATDPPSYGPYQLHGRLGAGGMGVVYLAFGPDNAPVALKVLQPTLTQDEQYRARFVREVSAARRVDSPYVARVVAAQTDGDPLWMATEYVEGATLAHAVETNGPVPPDRLHGLASDLANAVAALHAGGLVHRDLKPANVILAWSGPKLIDFGIAKYEGSTDLTEAGVTVGSLLWMSPEVLNGHSADRAGDVFAWGLCVAFAGTGRPPFGEGNATAVAYRISHAEPYLGGLPRDLSTLVAAALAKDPADRPSAPDLCAALGSRGSAATAVALPRPNGGWTGPNPAGTGPAAPPPIWTPPVPPGPGAPPGPLPPPEPARSRRGLVMPLAVLAALAAAAGIAVAVLLSSSGSGKPAASSSLRPTVAPSAGSATPSPSQAPSATAGPSASPTPSASPSSPALTPAGAAQALDRLLTTSSRSRADVVSAVASAQACDAPAAAAVTLRQAATARETELTRLDGIDLSSVDTNGQLKRTLSDALAQSRSADLSFAAWAESVAGCSGSAPHGSNYEFAASASQAATASKHAFVARWNPLARKYGLATRQTSEI